MPQADNLVVHVIDDDDGVRDALTLLLTEAGFSVRSYRTGTEFLAAMPTVAPGCIVTDIRMPGIDGLELQQKLRESKSTLPIIFITGHGDVPMAVRALRAGALDFIEKPFDESALIEAVRAAMRAGERAHDSSLAASEVQVRIDSLTPREREVLDCLVVGRPNKITAFELGMSVRTVEVHRARIMQKMNARSLSELVRLVLGAKQGAASAG